MTPWQKCLLGMFVLSVWLITMSGAIDLVIELQSMVITLWMIGYMFVGLALGKWLIMDAISEMPTPERMMRFWRWVLRRKPQA